ncbi:hypothetical protein NDU88_005257 [Pleurodeles waltl]|uniref:Uncharacterized protein n=1 Tax=Pleurodeles waltl TaxID=8319 RepID=A0AAV7PHJ9_PLEWA|nr:hypothetical protein NDU88_005257 [Pleurodeles waltl]
MTDGLDRELDSPTTSNIESGAERRSADSCGHKIEDIGNPDGRIPEHIPARSREEETIAEAGNPDIRVPDSLKRDDGLRAWGTLNARDAEEGDEQRGERREVVDGHTPAEEQTSTGQDDTTTGQDGPKELELPPRPRRDVSKSGTVLLEGQTSLYSE